MYSSDQAFDIAYHMYWPYSSDPFWIANNVDNLARKDYYGVTGTPTMKCDGSTCGTTQSSITSAINNRLPVPSPLWMDLDLSATADSITTNCKIVSDINISGNYVFHTMLLARYTYLPQSPNQQPHHYSALLKIAPTANGQHFSATANDTVYYTVTVPLDPTWELQNLDVACFVQNNDTKEFIQAIRAQAPIDFPNLVLNSFATTDINGNLDGRVDAGETGQVIVTLGNLIPFHEAEQVVAQLTTTDTLIDVTHGTVNLPNIVPGDSANNAADPFLFDVDPELQAHVVTFTVTVTAQPENFQASYPISFMVGRPNLLLLNDDTNGGFQNFYELCLDSLGRIYDTWNQAQLGAVPEPELLLYPLLIWYTGNDVSVTLSEDEQQKISNYLNAGGRLLLSSQNLGDLWGQSNFYHDVIHAEHVENSVNMGYNLTGISGDPISDGTLLELLGPGGAGNPNSPSSLNPVAPAEGIYTYDANGSFGALRCETGNTRFVYFSLPFEAISGLGGTTTRTQVLANCITWLETPVNVKPQDGMQPLPNQLQIAALYPNPFNPTTEISIMLPQAGYTEVLIYDLQGKLVQILYKGVTTAGNHLYQWDACDFHSGIYFIKLLHEDQSRVVKAVFLK